MNPQTEKNKVIKFDLHWLTGEISRIEGNDIADAFRRAGFSAGALRALDYYSNVEEVASQKIETLDNLTSK